MDVVVGMERATYGRTGSLLLYKVKISGYKDGVHVKFENLAERKKIRWGEVRVPTPVAQKLGYALLLASSGPVKDIVFEVDEKPNEK